jgi:DNA ligase-1
MAEKAVMRAIAASAAAPLRRVQAAFHRIGDLGDVAAQYAEDRRSAGLTLQQVFERLRKVASTRGAGSQATKLALLADLLQHCSAREAKYTARIVLGTLRLGVAEMTFLYGLTKALTGSKKAKPILENAFNVLSDLGEVAERALRSGVEALRRVRPVVCKPVRMMLAQRVKDLAEIPRHISGLVHVEYKYDGERVQAHVPRRGDIVLYSRRQEDITHQYPDVVQALRDSFRGKEAILEGEVVAIEVATGRLKDFQTLMQRHRKHDVEAYVGKIPVKYFLFDLLHLDGQSLLQKPLALRQETLARCVQESERLAFAASTATKDLEEVESFFAEAIERGAEGVVTRTHRAPTRPGRAAGAGSSTSGNTARS